MPCDYDLASEPYDDEAWFELYDYLRENDGVGGMHAPGDEDDDEEYLSDHPDRRYEMDVYDEDNSTMTHIAFGTDDRGTGSQGISGAFFSSDEFIGDYGGSLYSYIEAHTGGAIQSEDIGGVVLIELP